MCKVHYTADELWALDRENRYRQECQGLLDAALGLPSKYFTVGELKFVMGLSMPITHIDKHVLSNLIDNIRYLKANWP